MQLKIIVILCGFVLEFFYRRCLTLLVLECQILMAFSVDFSSSSNENDHLTAVKIQKSDGENKYLESLKRRVMVFDSNSFFAVGYKVSFVSNILLTWYYIQH